MQGEDWLKTQLLESEQRFVKTQVRLDGLLRDLAASLKMADTRDADQLLDEVAKLAKGRGRAPAPPSTPPTRQRPVTARAKEDKSDLQKELATALETIAQQDRWIATLQGREPALREMHDLRQETARLREQVGDRTALQELQARLQRHIDFRNALLRTLHMTASATDDSVLLRVEQLVSDATRPNIGALSASLSAGPGTLYKDALSQVYGDKLRPLTAYNMS